MTTVALEDSEVTHDYALAVWNQVMILEWRQPITMSSWGRFEASSEGVSTPRSGANGYDLIIRVDADTAGVPPDVRDAMANHLKRRPGHYRSLGLVFEASGIQATMLRTVASAIVLMSRQPVPSRVFKSVRENALWLEELHGTKELADSLCLVIDKLRQTKS